MGQSQLNDKVVKVINEVLLQEVGFHLPSLDFSHFIDGKDISVMDFKIAIEKALVIDKITLNFFYEPFSFNVNVSLSGVLLIEDQIVFDFLSDGLTSVLFTTYNKIKTHLIDHSFAFERTISDYINKNTKNGEIEYNTKEFEDAFGFKVLNLSEKDLKSFRDKFASLPRFNITLVRILSRRDISFFNDYVKYSAYSNKTSLIDFIHEETVNKV